MIMKVPRTTTGSDLVLIILGMQDHINFSGMAGNNPLVGPNG